MKGENLAKARSLMRRSDMHLTETQVDAITEEERKRLDEDQERVHLYEMETIGDMRWGNNQFSIQIHGASTTDRPAPHVHIYLKNDHNKKRFNFEVSIVDLVSNDELVLIYQLDRKNNIKITNRDDCSWTGYADIFDGMKNFLFSPPQSPIYHALIDNLHAAIYAWNNETDMSATLAGENPMKEWLDTKGIQVLPKYQKYFEPINFGNDGPQNIDVLPKKKKHDKI